jgi:UDP-3-O-[3-hydroxymyristoyl] glucosamine N-acyltransferase
MTIQEIAELVGATPALQAGEIRRVSGFDDASSDAAVFAQDDASAIAALNTAAGLVFAPLATDSEDLRILRVRNPKYAFALCARALAAVPGGPLVHPSAVIDPTAKLGEGTRVAAGAVIEAGVITGANCDVGSRVTLCRGARLGDRVIVQAGAVIGSTGFGYVRNAATGEHILFPQQGACVLEDDVEVGANTTIDRGALGETRIGRGTKIDNLVHIAHNCIVGKNVIIAAQVGISGSCTIEDGAVIAGQVGLGDHVTVGTGVILGGSAGVFPHKHVQGPGQMFMGIPAEPVKDYLKTIARVRRLK